MEADIQLKRTHYNEEEEEQVSDCESCTNINNYGKFDNLFDDDLIRLDEDNAIFDAIGRKFLLILGLHKGNQSIIKAIHKINWSNSHTLLARRQCFKIFLSVTNCMKYAWNCDSKEGIQSIVSHGFGHRELRGLHGIALTSFKSLARNVQNCVTDQDGLKHVLFCQVISSGSEEENLEQLNNSDDEDVNSSIEYVQSTKMNTHILPAYVVSFRTSPCLEGFPKVGETRKKLTPSPKMSIAILILVLSKCLPQQTMKLINKRYKEFKKGKFSRQHFIRDLQEYAGRDVLIEIIKLWGANKVVVTP